MSGDRLSVDLDGLVDFAGNLESIRTRMNATRALLATRVGQLGAAEVEGALDNFESNWSDGRKKIDANTSRLATMATDAADGIRAADNDLATSLSAGKNGAGG